MWRATAACEASGALAAWGCNGLTADQRRGFRASRIVLDPVNGLSAQSDVLGDCGNSDPRQHVRHLGELLSRVARLAAKVGAVVVGLGMLNSVADTQSCCHAHPRLHRRWRTRMNAWGALQYVGTGLSLVAFVVAAILLAYRARLAHRAEIIKSAPDDRHSQSLSERATPSSNPTLPRSWAKAVTPVVP